MELYLQILVAVLLLLFMLFLVVIRIGSKKKRAFVVLLGDIGRSPRMQFHAISLAKSGFEVYLFGYKGSEPYPEVANNQSIHLKYVAPFPDVLHRGPRTAVFVLKVIWFSATLLTALLLRSKPSHILLQNPPSLPTIAVCWFVSLLRNAKFVIDWHNYGYSILALQLSRSHPLVAVHRCYEEWFGRLAADNICVTYAMREDLSRNWNIRSVTMHDRPMPIFADLDIAQQHELFCKLDIFREDDHWSGDDVEMTLLTVKDTVDGEVRYRDSRPALLVSSTSWTEDEDFSLLLDALDVYDKYATLDSALPSVICVITGKGPQKERYMQLIDSKQWDHVKVFTPWLRASDYPRLLASADLGVCLHKSSSGLDLPMKVVDMFGCRLPVCAVNFPCLTELVQHDKNGMVFDTESELARQLQELLHGFPDGCSKLRRYRDSLKAFQQLRWDDAWTETVLPIFADS